MNDLPQRPKFYLHRSRRFWGGLAVLILLFGWWYVAQSKDSEVSLSRWETISPGYGDKDISDRVILSQESGSLAFRYRHDELGNRAVKRPHWDLRFKQSGNGIIAETWPAGKLRMESGYFFLIFSLPIWVIIFLWTILWPLWMRRGDRKEEERFRKLLGHEE